MPLSDQEERRAAVFTDDHAFVWASAGTGKTHTLTLRALVLIWRFGGEGLFSKERHQRLQAAREAVRQVVLTTFTRKAAAEMQTRLFRYLDLFVQSDSLRVVLEGSLVRHDRLFREVAEFYLNSSPGRSFENVRRGAEALAEVATELQVSTLHSLAAGILRRHPVESGLPVDCRFAGEDEDQPAELEEQLLERWWQIEALQNDAVQAWLGNVLGVIPLDHVKIWFRLMLRRPWIVDKLRRELSRRADDTETRGLLEALAILADCLTKLPGSKLQRTGDELSGLLKGDGSSDWTAICRFLLDNEEYLFHKPGKSLTKAVESQSTETRRYLTDFDRVYGLALQNLLSSEAGRVWESWRRLLESFLEWSRDAGIRELGMLTFDDMIRLAVRLLADHPEVRKLEHERIGALLVDEFQDTDPEQLELLRLLLARPQGCGREVLGFFVGDEKQSIYRFRGADVGSVLGFYRRYGELVRCRRPWHEYHLQTSFRSDPRILDFVNEFFAEPLDLARGKAKLEPFREAGVLPPDWLLLQGGGPEGRMAAAEAREAAAQATLQVIQAYLHEGRPYRDFLVLARDGWDLNVLLPVLNRAGIPVVSLGTRTFFRQPEVLDTLNLLIAMHHPHDRLAVAAVLRSPLILLEDQWIDRLVRQLGAEQIFLGDRDLPEGLPPVAKRRIERLRVLARDRLKTGLGEWLAEVRRFVPMFAYLDPNDYEGRVMARIDRVLSGFQKECLGGGSAPLVWLLTQRQRAARADAWDSQLGEDVALADETIDAVRVMTIHKAKGLEGRVVIVFDWGALLQACFNGRRSRGDGGFCLEQTDAEGLSHRELSLPWGRIEIRTPEYCGAVRREQDFELQEARRLAYVAATRARDRLVLLHPSKKNGKELVEHLDHAHKMGLVGVQPPPVHSPELPLSPPIPSTFDEKAYEGIWTRRLSSWGSRKEPLLVTPTDPDLDALTEEQEETGLNVQRRRRSQEEAVTIGLLVHACLERGIQRRDSTQDLLRAVACELGLDPSSAAALKAGDILQRFFRGDLLDASGRSLAERLRNARIRGREIPIYLRDEGRHWHGIIDLVLEEEDNRIVGVDFKTGRLADPLPESYARQQRIYTEALRRAVPNRSVTFEFWWLG